MKLRNSIVLAPLFVAMAGPAFAQQETGQAAGEETAQTKPASARENTRMTYSREANTVNGTVVDRFTVARNDRNGGTLTIIRADGR